MKDRPFDYSKFEHIYIPFGINIFKDSKKNLFEEDIKKILAAMNSGQNDHSKINEEIQAEVKTMIDKYNINEISHFVLDNWLFFKKYQNKDQIDNLKE